MQDVSHLLGKTGYERYLSNGICVSPSSSISKPFLPMFESTQYLYQSLEYCKAHTQDYENAKSLSILTGRESNILVIDIDNKSLNAKDNPAEQALEIFNKAFKTSYSDFSQFCNYAMATPNHGVHLFFKYNPLILTNTGLIRLDDERSIDILAQRPTGGITNCFSAECNSGYTKLFGELENIGPLEEELASIIVGHQNSKQVVKQASGFIQETINVNKLMDPLGRYVEAYLNTGDTAVFERLPFLKDKIKQPRRHEIFKTLCPLLSSDPTISRETGLLFLESLLKYQVVFEGQADEVETKGDISRVIRDLFINNRNFSYEETWREISEKVKEPEEKTILWFFNPTGGYYLRFDTTQPISNLVGTGNPARLAPSDALILYGHEKKLKKNIKAELQNEAIMVTEVNIPGDERFVIKNEGQFSSYAAFALNWFETSKYMKHMRTAEPNANLHENWQKYFANIFPDPEVRSYMFNWMNVLLQKPQFGYNTIALKGLAGGEGKSLFFSLLTKLFGQSNVALGIPASALTSNFMFATIKNKLLILLEELEGLDNERQKEKFIRVCKTISGSPTITGEEKFKNFTGEAYPNYANILINSNSPDALLATENQKEPWRKFCEFDTSHKPLKNTMTRDQIASLLTEPMLLNLVEYLKSLELDQVRFEEPLHTEKYKSIVENNVGDAIAIASTLADETLSPEETAEILKQYTEEDREQELFNWATLQGCMFLQKKDFCALFDPKLWWPVRKALINRFNLKKYETNLFIPCALDTSGAVIRTKKNSGMLIRPRCYAEVRERYAKLEGAALKEENFSKAKL